MAAEKYPNPGDAEKVFGKRNVRHGAEAMRAARRVAQDVGQDPAGEEGSPCPHFRSTFGAPPDEEPAAGMIHR